MSDVQPTVEDEIRDANRRLRDTLDQLADRVWETDDDPFAGLDDDLTGSDQ